MQGQLWLGLQEPRFHIWMLDKVALGGVLSCVPKTILLGPKTDFLQTKKSDLPRIAQNL